MLYISQEKLAALGQWHGGTILVRYYTFRGLLGFEFEATDLSSALQRTDLIRRYDNHLELHRKKATYCPYAEFMQMDEDGEWAFFGQVLLPGEPPWARPRKR